MPPGLASLADKIYYRGINPAGGPLGTPAVINRDNSENRNEPVSFLEPGTYLVICNVRPHLLDGSRLRGAHHAREEHHREKAELQQGVQRGGVRAW